MNKEHVNAIACSRVLKTLTLVEIEEAINKDKTLRDVRAAIKLNKCHSEVVKILKQINDELTVTAKGEVLRSWIVIPKSLQPRATSSRIHRQPDLLPNTMFCT